MINLIRARLWCCPCVTNTRPQPNTNPMWSHQMPHRTMITPNASRTDILQMKVLFMGTVISWSALVSFVLAWLGCFVDPTVSFWDFYRLNLGLSLHGFTYGRMVVLLGDEGTFRRWSPVEGSWVIGGVPLKETFRPRPSYLFLHLGYFSGFVQLSQQNATSPKDQKQQSQPTIDWNREPWKKPFSPSSWFYLKYVCHADGSLTRDSKPTSVYIRFTIRYKLSVVVTSLPISPSLQLSPKGKSQDVVNFLLSILDLYDSFFSILNFECVSFTRLLWKPDNPHFNLWIFSLLF